MTDHPHDHPHERAAADPSGPRGPWGRMRDEQPPAPPARDVSARGGPGQDDPSAGDRPAIRARRRAVRGVSFALISLGILLAVAFGASGRALLGALGLLPAILGAAGFLAVALGVPAVLRLPRREHRPGRALCQLPGLVLALAIAFLAAAFWTDAASPETGSPWTIVWLVSAATLVTFAGLAFGLVAASRLTVPDDDDDAPLRRVDWDEEYPGRFGDEPGRPPEGDGYDSSWIRGERR